MFKPLVSIIIRTKNEENWINSCIDAILKQKYKKFEIIIVDNYSTDNTLKKIKKYNLRICKIKKFFPGKALNLGIKNSKGSIIVCLSGHCIPKDEQWLWNLIKALKTKKVAGVYGKQEPLSFTNDLDKRDLFNMFGKDRKVQIKDSFFHNANSAIKKSLWNKVNFNEKIQHIEDRYWAEEIIKKKLRIIYEPKASVYHWHGVNHGMDKKRAREIVQLLDNIKQSNQKISNKKIKNLNILGIIPKRGRSKTVNGSPLIRYTIENCKKSKYINDIVVSTDNSFTASQSKKYGAKVPFLRPKNLSENYSHIFDVIQYSYEKLENLKYKYDIVVILEETYPFRHDNLIDKMIEYFIEKNTDTLIAGKLEQRALWNEDTKYHDFTLIEEDSFIPRSLKRNKNYIGLFGLCCVTLPSNIKSKNIISKNIKIYPIKDHFMSVEINDFNKNMMKFIS